MAVLEDQRGDAERGAGGKQVGEHADERDHRRLQGDQQEQEAEREHDADHLGVWRRARLSRSWFSADGPPTSVPAGSSARSRSMVAPTAGSEGSLAGTAWISTSPPPVGLGRHHRGDARVGVSDAAHLRARRPRA